jgi:probable HAF family extracellular repeat protein
MRAAHPIAFLTALLFGLGQLSTADAAQFSGIGFFGGLTYAPGYSALPGSYSSSYGWSISADGFKVVGQSFTPHTYPVPSDRYAGVWTKSQTGWDISISAYVSTISRDGTILAGSSESDEAWIRWQNGTVQSLGKLNLPPGAVGMLTSSVVAISDDGSVAVGDSSAQPFRWTSSGGMMSIGDGWVADVSGDGSLVVGSRYLTDSNGTRNDGWIWSSATGQVSLGSLAGAAGESNARGISRDGKYVVGYTEVSATRTEAFIWSQEAGMVSLGGFPQQDYGTGYAVSDDGSRVVGNSQIDNQIYATVWSSESGWQDLVAVLTASGIDMTGWRLYLAGDITGDGRFVTGYGVHNGITEGFWAELPGMIPDVANTTATPSPTPAPTPDVPPPAPNVEVSITKTQHNARKSDIDGDLVPNRKDRDIDGDGVPNRRDKDVDGDGISNHRDRDMDGDGVPNRRDITPKGITR